MGLNAPHLLALVNGDPGLLDCLVQTFIEDCPQALAKIRTAIDRRDDGELTQAAHAFAGSVSLFSTDSPFQAAHTLERMGRANDLSGAANIYADLEAGITWLTQALLQLVAAESRKGDVTR